MFLLFPLPLFSVPLGLPLNMSVEILTATWARKGSPEHLGLKITLPVELALSRCSQQQHLLHFIQRQLSVLGLGLQAGTAETGGMWVPIPALRSAVSPVP